MEPSFLFTSVTADPARPVDRDLETDSGSSSGGRHRLPLRNAARLSNSIPQRATRRPTHDDTSDFPSHGFQLFYFKEAAVALPKVLLACERIRSVQFSVKKSMKSEFPFRTGPDCTYAGFAPW